MSDATNTELQELLPFWVNGSLDEADSARVAEAVARDPALQQEAALLRAMRASLKQTHEAHTGPGEFGLARLHRSLDADASVPQKANPPQRALAWGVGSALAASLATVLVLGLQGGSGPEPLYEQASGEPAAMVVTFSPEASVAEISALVRDSGLTIIDGPSSLGLFRMILLPGEDVSLAGLAAELEEDERVLRVDIEE
ncbi:hypothetical protein Dshi_3422 [Dinoroseobacter shibae DFL 12 = DSM 16493]|jgi:anti-sigma factor RsiW|uniref:Transmembrane anti-sigma factor n=1 Tax=Dinoroseobacter shibae (strain DSM 16493 / NCIMB 14021 / DFL 12) TaxID=398580 RepID=A8LP90_DINSH|nr:MULTISPECIES: hypothetical protein [Dinoroseobacter]ABV95155.1 hypothetical protein Dshi_3422 [Dinoroseobacter shibae DFL 12 = DSM 16493]MDD9718126.1 hypothetical protein [Dinoroseobacter sp. PD6]URF46568.1 hypothetical protein M8008_17590 [Dinoroseobacter shibae]URF50874.1 hypothetical protein M8007_17590 [Dinoroseobacter shibae]